MKVRIRYCFMFLNTNKIILSESSNQLSNCSIRTGGGHQGEKMISKYSMYGLNVSSPPFPLRAPPVGTYSLKSDAIGFSCHVRILQASSTLLSVAELPGLRQLLLSLKCHKCLPEELLSGWGCCLELQCCCSARLHQRACDNPQTSGVV